MNAEEISAPLQWNSTSNGAMNVPAVMKPTLSSVRPKVQDTTSGHPVRHSAAAVLVSVTGRSSYKAESSSRRGETRLATQRQQNERCADAQRNAGDEIELVAVRAVVDA